MATLAVVAGDFGNKLKAHDKRNFESCRLNDLHQEVSTIQSQRESTNTMMNMTRLERFLEAIEQLGNMFYAAGTSGRDSAMPLLWGSVRYVLKVTNPSDRAFDNVLDVYEKLGVHVPHLCQYEHIFTDSSEFEDCLVNIYRDIQKFHEVSYQLFSLRQKLWQQLHRSVWKDLQNTFSQIFSSLDSHTSFMQSHLGNFQSASVSSASSLTTTLAGSPDGPRVCTSERWARYRMDARNCWARFDNAEISRKIDQKISIKRRIPSSNKMAGMHKDLLEKRCPNTGRWLFRSYGTVTDWMVEDDIPNSTIWLHGSKGFGKTFLASILVEELEKRKKQKSQFLTVPPSSKIYYFYCQEDDVEHRTYLGVLKGILTQMVDQVDYIIPLCEDRLAHEGVDNLSNAEVAEALIKVFIEYGPRQYIIIDGLNECEDGEARRIANFFMEQATGCDNNVSPGQLRVLFVSQTMTELRKCLPEDDASIKLDPKDNSGDIRTYVEHRMDEFSDFNLTELEKANVENTVCYQSKEMFLFAQLAMDYLLHQVTKGDLLEKSSQDMMPDSLPEMYEKLIGSLKDRLESAAQWEMAKLLLGWLVCAKRSLQWHELQSILSFDLREKTVDFDKKMVRQDVRKFLGSMVHILDGGHIRLIHPTVRKFIVQNIHINEIEVQYRLTALCLAYLSSPCFAEDYGTENRKELARTGYFSFQDYACSYWYFHIENFIRDCNRSFEMIIDDQVEDDFSMSLEDFIITHRSFLTTEVHQSLERAYIDTFSNTSIYDNLFILWNHIFTHQKRPIEERNTVGITQIDKALKENRAVIETNFSPTDIAYNRDTIGDYYGPNLFKCKHTLCDFFYIGYDKEKQRERHENRHDRPYPCPARCRMAPIGFSNQKDKERHVRIYHPELSERPSMFEDPFRRPENGSFVCNICKKTFTRRENLKGHERSHFGTRPYQCYQCGKAFARISDCRRHEKNQSCKFGGRRGQIRELET